MSARPAQMTFGAFAPQLRPELSQWHSPTGLAAQIVKWAGVTRGMRVLEPCAGGGNLVRPCLAAGAVVTAVEIDPVWAEAMRSDPTLAGLNVLVCDFLSMRLADFGGVAFDIVIMNPPFEDGRDAIFLEHALEFAPRVVCIGPSRIMYGKEKHARVWSKHGLQGLVNRIERPSFGLSGRYTESHPKTDFCIVDVLRGQPGCQPRPTEWW